MFVTVHVATGAAIATVVPNPLIAVPLAFASHFVMDAIPHWHNILKGEEYTRKTHIIAFIDFVLAVATASLLLITTSNYYLLYGIIAGTIMDTDAVLYPLFERRGWRRLWPDIISRLHGSIQNATTRLWGLLPQAVILFASLLIVFFLNF